MENARTAFNSSTDFAICVWQSSCSPLPLFIIRTVLFCLAFIILVWSLKGASLHWFLYLTNWSSMLVTAMLAVGFKISYCATWNTAEYLCGLSEATNMLYETLYVLAIPLSVLISALYWLLLFDIEAYEEVDMALDLATHVGIPLIAFIELLVTRVPVYMEKMWLPILVGLIYVFFTLIYYLLGFTDRMGNPFIYAVLYWGHWIQSIIVVVGSLILLVVIYTLLFCLAYIRDQVAPRSKDKSVHNTFKRMSVFNPVANPNTNPINKAFISPIPGLIHKIFELSSVRAALYRSGYDWVQKIWNSTAALYVYDNLFKCDNSTRTTPAPRPRFRF